MEVDRQYTEDEILTNGLLEKKVEGLSTRVFINGTKVYFFEKLEKQFYKLYLIINKRSFFL